MTLIELASKTASLIEDNQRAGKADWNRLQVAVEHGVFGPRRKNGRRGYKASITPVDCMPGIRTVGGATYFIIRTTSELMKARHTHERRNN